MNTTPSTRRNFLQSAAWAVAGTALGARVQAADPVPADAANQHAQASRSTKTPLTTRLVRNGGVLKIEIDGAIFELVPELLNPFADLRAGSALCADLDHALVLPGRFDHLAAFEHIVGRRLLDEHVFAGLARPDRLEGVPVVGTGDADCVNRRIVEQRAHVDGQSGAASGKLFLLVRRTVHALFVHIAQRGDLDVVFGHFAKRDAVGTASTSAQADDGLIFSLAFRA